MPQALQVVNGRERIKRARILLVLSSVWCIASMFLMVLARLLPPSDAVCDQRNLVFSPLQSAIRYDWVNYGDMWAQGSRYRTSFNTSISEDTDRAWLELLADVDANVPKTMIDALGQETNHRWKPHPSGGYSAKLGGFYQMQCLNEIRQHVKANLDDTRRSENRHVVDECFELLRQKFMCDMDATPYLLMYDAKTTRGDAPDMDTMHKCRNYVQLRTTMQEFDGMDTS